MRKMGLQRKVIPYGHILYVAPHGLGDLSMSLPAIEFLSEQGYRLTVLVKSNAEKNYFEYTTSFKSCDVLVIDEYRKLGAFRGMAKLIWKLFLARFVAAVPQMNVNERLFNILLLVTFIRWRSLSVSVLEEAVGTRPTVRNKHKVDINIELASRIIGARTPSALFPGWKSSPPKSRCAPKIALAPGSGEVESHKRWPASRYAALSITLMSLYPNAVIEIFGSPNEAKLCRDIAKQSNGMASFAGVGSVTDLYDALKDSDICIANCNGASHVAAHAGSIVIGIYGPTEAAFTGAHCNSMFEVNLKLKCSPCYRKGYISGCGNPICLTDLNESLVVGVVRRILG